MATDAPRIGGTGRLTGARPTEALAAALEPAALERAGGTVTAFLEGVAGERIDVDVVAQAMDEAGPGSRLGLGRFDPLLRRTALLAGHDTGRVFVYAESQIATGRLTDEVVRRLREGRDPIGRILVEHGIESRRQLLDGEPEPSGDPGAFGSLWSRTVLARCTLIRVGSDPAVLVSEWFLDTVVDALTARGR